jgi:hypothetical protein
MANFSADMRGMLPFVANTFSADVSSTMEVFDWKPISLEKIIVDTAQSIDPRFKEINCTCSGHKKNGYSAVFFLLILFVQLTSCLKLPHSSALQSFRQLVRYRSPFLLH